MSTTDLFITFLAVLVVRDVFWLIMMKILSGSEENNDEDYTDSPPL